MKTLTIILIFVFIFAVIYYLRQTEYFTETYADNLPPVDTSVDTSGETGINGPADNTGGETGINEPEYNSKAEVDPNMIADIVPSDQTPSSGISSGPSSTIANYDILPSFYSPTNMSIQIAPTIKNLENDIDLKVKFSLKMDYFEIEDLSTFETDIHEEICDLLDVSSYRIKIDDISIGSVVIRFTITKTSYNNFKPIKTNDSLISKDLYQEFINFNKIDDSYLYLKLIDKYTLTIDKTSSTAIQISNIIPKELNFIEKIIKSKKPFRMFTLLPKEGIYPDNTPIDPNDTKLVKLYLTVKNKYL